MPTNCQSHPRGPHFGTTTTPPPYFPPPPPNRAPSLVSFGAGKGPNGRARVPLASSQLSQPTLVAPAYDVGQAVCGSLVLAAAATVSARRRREVWIRFRLWSMGGRAHERGMRVPLLPCSHNLCDGTCEVRDLGREGVTRPSRTGGGTKVQRELVYKMVLVHSRTSHPHPARSACQKRSILWK